MNTDQPAKTKYDVAIVGAGPAGLAAALEARRLNWRVILIDQATEPGGKSAHFTCKADEQCRQCSACQVCDAIDAADNDANIDIVLNTAVDRCKDLGTEYHLTLHPADPLAGKSTIITHRLLLATGFSFYDLTLKPALGFNQFRNVTSLEQLEKHLKTHSDLLAFFESSPHVDTATEDRAISAAFIQCVGSRDQTASANYCSHVCCRTSLRMANLMLHQKLVTEVTLFYMDLQMLDHSSRMLGMDTRRFHLIRGLPAEVLQDSDGRLRLRYEGQQANHLEEAVFDLVVLAGGIRPVEPLPDMAGMKMLSTDSIGFWQVSPTRTPETIAVAGTASGPMDILSAMAHGRYSIRKLAETEDSNP